MHYELFISLRYLRAKRREAFISLITAISTVGVMIGVMVLNITLSIMTGFEEDLRDRILGFNPHIVLSSFSGAIADYPQVVEEAEQVPGVMAVAPLIYAQVMVSSRQNVSGVVVRGVEPHAASKVVDLGRHLKEGSLAGFGRLHEVKVAEDGKESVVRLPGLIVGQQLAQQLGVVLGDPVNVMSPFGTQGPFGMVPKVKRFVVAGLFDSGMYDYDLTLIYMTLKDAQGFFDLGDRVTNIELRVKDVYASAQIARRIEGKLGFPFRARDWTEINKNLFAALRLEKVVYFLVLLLMVLVAAFNIIATLIMVVMEKRKDIAILKSMGATPSAIGRIFTFKGLIIGGVGTLLGTMGGFGGCWLLQRYQFIELPKDVFYVSTLPVKIYPENFLIVALASILICLVAAIYPARQAARLVPVEVIRYE
jgi:lipoprotein-releasing system permease protein